MDASANYQITIKGTGDEIEKIGSALKETIKDVEYVVDEHIEIDRTSDCVFEDEICELAKVMAKKAAKASFVMEGVIDTSSTAGEYMDFCIKFDGKTLSASFSDWYLEDWMGKFDSYESFCDEFCETDCVFTEDDYSRFKEHEFLFTLETEDGDIFVTEVPLNDPVTLEY